MSSIIIGDESWVYGYDPEKKQIPSQWKTASSPRPKKALQVKSNVKTMLIAFFDIVGLVRHECVPRGQTVSKEFYKTGLQRHRHSSRKHRFEKWRSGSWILHHTRCRSWLRHCATSHKVTGSIPDGVSEIFVT
jgi:hypothetical protein